MPCEKTDEDDCASDNEVLSDDDEKETNDTFFSNDKGSKKPETFVQDELNDLCQTSWDFKR